MSVQLRKTSRLRRTSFSKPPQSTLGCGVCRLPGRKGDSPGPRPRIAHAHLSPLYEPTRIRAERGKRAKVRRASSFDNLRAGPVIT